MKIKKAGEAEKSLKDTGGFQGMTANWIWTADDGMPNYAMRLMEFLPEGRTSYHSHLEEHEFYILEGEAAVINAAGEETRLYPGDALYCGPSEPHQLRNAGSSMMRLICTIPILPGGDGKATTSAA